MSQGPCVRGVFAVLAGFVTTFSALYATAGHSDKPGWQIDAKLSPDGRWVAVSAEAGPADAPQCWLVPVGPGDARALSDVEPNGAQTLAWSAEGRLRFEVVDRVHGVPELRWIDPDTDHVIESTRDREVIRAELRGQSGDWATVDERRLSGNRLVRTIHWRDQSKRFEFTARGDSQLLVSAVPGTCFYSNQNGPTTQIFRVDVASGTTREVARSESASVRWTPSFDGSKMLLCEDGPGSRSRVVDATQGTLLHGPWMTSSMHWIGGSQSRYLAGSIGEHRRLFDTLRDREVEIGDDDGAWPEITALADGRFLVEHQGILALHDDNLSPLRTLFSAPDAPALAKR